MLVMEDTQLAEILRQNSAKIRIFESGGFVGVHSRDLDQIQRVVVRGNGVSPNFRALLLSDFETVTRMRHKWKERRALELLLDCQARVKRQWARDREASKAK